MVALLNEYDDARDESNDRIRKEHERKREHDSSALEFVSVTGERVLNKDDTYRKQNKALSSSLCSTPCAISDLHWKIDTKGVTMLSTEHEMATKPPIRAILSNSGRVMSVTEALRMMADCG